MKFALLSLFALFSLVVSAGAEGKKIVIFATLIADTPVELSDGSKWQMDKGDAFPVVMFKEQQTKVVLQLAGATFLVEAKFVKILEEALVTDETWAAYRRNVETYLEGRTKKWRAAARGKADGE